jgi:lipopolysaccharide transport system ATP-binding protein
MNTVIKVENLSKKYIISHQRQERYTAFRDVMARGVKRMFNRGIVQPFKRLTSSSTVQQFPSSTTEEFYALRDVSFEINQGDRVGIIGRNGAGKTTLLKLLSRITEPTTGRITLKGRVASLLEVGTGFHPELTGRENIFLNGAILGMGKAEIKKKFDEIVDFAEVEKFLDTPVKRYSSGMYVRLAFAVAAHLEPEILMVDEVLAVGDAQFQKKCLGKMEEVGKEGRTVLFVSHNMGMIESLCSKALFLNHGTTKDPMSVREGIALYLGYAGLTRKSFTNKPLKNAYVRQIESVIEIYAEYALDSEIKLPCLGFVISDYFGNPICGANPLISPPQQVPGPSRNGSIKVIIETPKLLNGTYKISLWFGDGREEFFSEKDCLTFEVLNMVSHKQLPANVVGPVSPRCEWEFVID